MGIGTPKVKRVIGGVPGILVRHPSALESRVRLIEYDSGFHNAQSLALSPPADSELSGDSRIVPKRPRRAASGSSAWTGDIPNIAVEESQPSKIQLRSDATSWINVDGLANIELIRSLGEQFGLHPLALEDVVNVHQIAKTDTYDGNIYIVVRMPESGERFSTEQVSLFLLNGIVLTLQERPGDCLNSVRERIAGSKGRIRSKGADYLAYAIIDAIVDGYFPVLDLYDERLTSIGELIDGDASSDIPKRLHDIRADLLNIRKVAQQHREAVTLLLREESELISAETLPFLRDCLDHIGRLIETADTYRETCGELRELYFAQLGQKTNDVMKVLTIIATVFIPMSFIAGVYGMNFDSEVSSLNMPELRWAFGYPFAIGVMLCTGGGLLMFLRRRGWL